MTSILTLVIKKQPWFGSTVRPLSQMTFLHTILRYNLNFFKTYYENCWPKVIILSGFNRTSKMQRNDNNPCVNGARLQYPFCSSKWLRKKHDITDLALSCQRFVPKNIFLSSIMLISLTEQFRLFFDWENSIPLVKTFLQQKVKKK
jgi:hypothetical protein